MLDFDVSDIVCNFVIDSCHEGLCVKSTYVTNATKFFPCMDSRVVDPIMSMWSARLNALGCAISSHLLLASAVRRFLALAEMMVPVAN